MTETIEVKKPCKHPVNQVLIKLDDKNNPKSWFCCKCGKRGEGALMSSKQLSTYDKYKP